MVTSTERPLCMRCADLDHLVFLPSGDVALTRRAGKHSKLRVVVVRFSRTRKRYERQGLLVEEHALARAEMECASDETQRELARQHAAARRVVLDAVHVAEFARLIALMFPCSPAEARTRIAEHACERYSGRVGRSAAAKQFDPDTIVLAVRAHIRHELTAYDDLLMRGISRLDARVAVAEMVETIARSWSGADGA